MLAETLSTTRTAVVLSPHLDDAAWSCGGWIARRTRHGLRTVVVSVFAGRASGALEPAAVAMHAAMGDPPDPVGTRLAEDGRAAEALGFEARHLDLLEALYRDGGAPFRPHLQGLDEVEGGPSMAAAVSRAVENVVSEGDVGVVAAPLAVGAHVDHMIVHWIARALAVRSKICFYEDFPYLRSKVALSAAIDRAGIGSSCDVLLDDVDFTQKLEGMSAYASQLYLLRRAIPIDDPRALVEASLRGVAALRGRPAELERYHAVD